MAKVKSNNFKETHGYTRAGSLFKSKDDKQQLEKKQARINSFSPSQNKQVAATVERNVDVPGSLKKGATLNDTGQYAGDQRYKKVGKRKVSLNPKFKKS